MEAAHQDRLFGGRKATMSETITLEIFTDHI